MKPFISCLAPIALAATLVNVPQLVHAQTAAAPAAAVAPLPAGVTTVVDLLQVTAVGDIRTVPRVPAVGAWGVVIGRAAANAVGHGIQVDAPKQAVVYPTIELLRPESGTIEFSVLTSAGADANAVRTLLDSIAVGGPSRFLLNLQGNKLSFSYTGEDGAAKPLEATVNWPDETPHKITIVWDAADMELLVDGTSAGRIEKPSRPAREPLALILGNNRDYNAPARLAVSGLRLSTAREAIAPPTYTSSEEKATAEDLSLRMAQGYQRRLYPLLERLRGQGVIEVPLAYALAQADIGDLERALETIKPIVADVNSPLNVQAIFLRADLLTKQGDFNGAYEQLQVPASNRDTSVAVRAKVRQAAVLFNQGNKQESLRLLGEIIAKYTDLPDVNEAYLMIGLDRFRSGDFQAAYSALRFMGVPGSKPRTTTAIGLPLEIKVADPDLAVRLNDPALPVSITTQNGDKEQVTLRAAFSKGVYVGNVETALGDAKPNDGVLQLIGGDKISILYADRLSNDAGGQARSVSIGVATDARLTVLALSALDVYREAQGYQKANLLSDDWEVVAVLPKTASAFFRDLETGEPRKKGTRFNRGFISNIKPGQSLYVELVEPDSDTTAAADKTTVELTTKSGKKLPVTLTETGPHTGVFAATVKTGLAGKAAADNLEVTINDFITARYVDPNPAQGTRDAVRLSRADIRASGGSVAVGLDVKPRDGEIPVFLRVSRVSGNNTVVTLKVEDRDGDESDVPDKLTVKLTAKSGPTSDVVLTETGTHTGVFTAALKLTTDDAVKTPGPGVFKTKAGDIVAIDYVDAETPEGTVQTRSASLKTNIAEDAKLKFLRQVVTQPVVPKGLRLAVVPPPVVTYEESTTLAPGSVYRVVLTDPDIVATQMGEMSSKVVLKASNGSSVEVPLRSVTDPKTLESRFEGDFFARLGDGDSPTRAYFSQTGSVIDIDPEKAIGLWFLPALNLQGKNEVNANYIEPIAANGQRNVPRKVALRVAADAQITLLNLQGNPLEGLKPGVKFELQIEDADGDITPKRDTVKATLASGNGDKVDLDLTETDVHSGIFSALVKTAFGSPVATDTVLQVNFGGSLKVTYNDAETQAGTAAVRNVSLTARALSDADGLLLTKVYDDPKFELETLVRLGESLYAVGAAELSTGKFAEGVPRTNASLQDAARILQQIVDRFPTSDYVAQSLYLIGKIRREEQKFDEAQKLFTRVIEDYPDDAELVPQSLFQLVLLHYAKGNIDDSTEAAMKLVYGYPKNSLVADAFLRISEYYYGKKEYNTAAYIYKRLLDRFPDNPKADLISYRMATAYYRAGAAGDTVALANAIRCYMEFATAYPDHELADDAMYWAADVAVKQNNERRAYTILTKQLVDYPKGDKRSAGASLRDKIKQNNPMIDSDQQM